MSQNEVRFLNPPSVEAKKKKYCRFKKLGIKYIDYKDADFLLKFVNYFYFVSINAKSSFVFGISISLFTIALPTLNIFVPSNAFLSVIIS